VRPESSAQKQLVGALASFPERASDQFFNFEGVGGLPASLLQCPPNCFTQIFVVLKMTHEGVRHFTSFPFQLPPRPGQQRLTFLLIIWVLPPSGRLKDPLWVLPPREILKSSNQQLQQRRT